MIHCPYCDPSHYVVYGLCGNCGRECHNPLPEIEAPTFYEMVKSLHKDLVKQQFKFKNEENS